MNINSIKYPFLLFVGLSVLFLACSKKYNVPSTINTNSKITLNGIIFQSSFLDYAIGNTKKGSLSLTIKRNRNLSTTTPLIDSVSRWQHVFSGYGQLTFNLLNSSQVSSIKDSVDLNNLSNYSKTIQNGIYNITLATKTTSHLADPFIRFSASNVNDTINQNTSIKFLGVTHDGVITIPSNAVKAGNIPIFSVSSKGANLTFNFGLSNGYYFLYVNDQVNGTVSLLGTAGSVLSKTFTVSQAYQYNLIPDPTSKLGGLNLTFAPFVYQSELLYSNLTPPPFDSTLIAFYPFTGYNANDASLYSRITINNDDNSLGSGSTTDRFGYQNAYSFNGTGNILSLSALNNPPKISGFTISAWVYFTSYLPPFNYSSSTQNQRLDIVEIDTSLNPLNPQGYRMSMEKEPVVTSGINPGSGIDFFSLDVYNQNFLFSNSSLPYLVFNYLTPLNTWFLVTYTQDITGNWQWYVNGNITNQGKVTPKPISFRKIYIGGSNPNYFWKGSLDEVRIYSRPLTPLEILYLSQN